MRYQVHLGADRNGRPRYRYFSEMRDAIAFVGAIFQRHGIVLGIVEAK